MENIILDQVIGFAKSMEDNFTVMNKLEEFTDLGYPVLLGASRKSFIGDLLDIPPVERDNGTGATTCLGITKGVQIFRGHDVGLHKEMAKMMDELIKGIGIQGS